MMCLEQTKIMFVLNLDYDLIANINVKLTILYHDYLNFTRWCAYIVWMWM